MIGSRRGDTDAADEIGEARVGAQRFVSWIHFEADYVEVANLIALLEPCESLIFVAKGDVYLRDCSRRHVTLLR